MLKALLIAIIVIVALVVLFYVSSPLKIEKIKGGTLYLEKV